MTLSITHTGPFSIEIQAPTDKYNKFMIALGGSQYLHLSVEEFEMLRTTMNDFPPIILPKE